MCFHLSSLLLILSCVCLPAHAEPLLSNGDFETLGAAGWPATWPQKEGATCLSEDGNHFLRLNLLRPTQFLQLPRQITVDPSHKAYRLTVRARYKDMYYGREIWWDGRILLDFQDKDGHGLTPAPSCPHWNKHSKDWATYTSEFLVPEGATVLRISPALIRVKSGTLDLDDLVLEPIAPEPLVEKQKEQAAKQEQEMARQLAQVKPKVPVAPADKLPPILKCEGNRLVTDQGEPVWLQGVSIPSLEWSEGGENILGAVEVAIRDWKANCIRLPVSAKFWRGKGPYRKDGGAAYQQIVDDAVNLCSAHGAYLVLDLHGFCAPTEADAAFWENAGKRYANHPVVLLELFNEPHSISWEIWRDGGMVIPPREFADAPAEDQIQPPPYHSVGLQKLVNTVRATGAKNVVIVGGLDWGYDLEGILQGFAIQDPQGRGIMYSSHIYPWKKDWQRRFLEAAARYPIFIGEVGTPPDYEKFQFIPVAERYPLEGWANDVLAMMQQYHLNWTGWSFHSQAGPCLLADKNFTPTAYWGVPVKQALAGEKFALRELR